MSRFSKGIVLTQHKEPAFSMDLVRFVVPQTDTLTTGSKVFAEDAQPDADSIIEIARAAQVVDERDGKLLYRKLQRAKGRAVAAIADAVDDEPYVSSKTNPLMRLRKEIVGGLQLCRAASGAKQAFIVVYKNISDLEMKIPRTIGGVKVVRLHGGYPADPTASRLNIGHGHKLLVGVGALVHLYRAVYFGKRQSTVFITVAGNCVASPMNMETSLGMTIEQVLERCGLLETPARVVCGGPMTGIAVLDTERTLVTYATRAVLAFRENGRDTHYSCLGCGRCERVCPRQLNPMYIRRFVAASYFAHLKPFDAHLCTGCGTCSYICPSKLNVAGAVRRAKQYALENFIAPQDKEADDNEV